jgi:hypothetical protein
MKKTIIFGVILAAVVLFVNSGFFTSRQQKKSDVSAAPAATNEAIVETNSASWD